MKNVLIAAATKTELSSLKMLQFENTELTYFLTGVGDGIQGRISQKADLLEDKIDLIINVGLCGNLSKGYEKGDLLLPSKVYLENDQTKTPILINNTMINRLKIDDPYFSVPFVTVSNPVNDAERKKRVLELFPDAVGVDMELYHWANSIQKREVDFVALKTISDFCENINLEKMRQETTRLLYPAKILTKKIIEIIWA